MASGISTSGSRSGGGRRQRQCFGVKQLNDFDKKAGNQQFGGVAKGLSRPGCKFGYKADLDMP
eukprot:12159732-Karenia_brevis.AAC.1